MTIFSDTFGIAMRNFTTYPEMPDPRALIAYARRAEELGFDSVWAWDHILLGVDPPFPIIDPLTLLAAVAARTMRINLGTGVLVLPLRNPVVLAKELSSLDLIAGGRLLLGMASGWYKREFDAVGVPFERRGRIMDRNLEILRRLTGLGLGFFDSLFGSRLRFAGFHQFHLFLSKGFFGRFTGFGGFLQSFELRRLIRLRRLQRGLVKINLRFGENEGAFKIGGEFLRVTVALQLRNFFSVVQVPKFSDLIGARRSETLAVAAHGHRRNRSGVFYFANQLPGVHVPKPHRAVFAS